MTKVQKWVVSLLAMVAILVLGFSFHLVNKANTKKQETTTTTSTSTTKKRTNEEAEQAKLLAQQYDYDGAIKELEGADTKLADKLKTNYEQEKEQLVAWQDPEKISHVFVHSLVADADKAFHDKEQAQGYKDYMITISEFKKTIQQLYDNGYVLVTFDDLVKEDSKGKLQFKGVDLPEGKKPLIFSQDDVNYYEYMKDAGFAEKLLVNKEGEVKNTYKENGQEKTGDYDMVPILDKFVEEHPDFSYRGSKGILALTGYNGALGYRTSKSEYGDNEKTEQEIAKAKEVADRLKDTGWTFASHTWGHINMAEVGQKQIAKDTQRWKDEVAPIIGDTDVLIYPHGADISDFQPYDKNPKYDYLKQQGFRIFCNVDASVPSWGQFNSDYYRNARINLDGIRFKSELDGQNDILEDFINVKDVYDDKRDK
ncbi:polysaccharide deacetylase family protein [Tetragenococcus koreensis]|uniref:Polysaccharide deacetylase family protein n=1 Tax=Tetragenococcus solitarius TaxID=71453 RepID=A0ABN3Y2Y1_9ENTE|nr:MULTISPECIES: polysaccharide deacetylase family protein [Tetragenococcus]MDN6409607.1 polysaccharide deacetylase family protein [Tetragenococcus halophilus]MDN6639731.1 polysaccharide deacetylase family protein [Tetragenococcus sp.]MCF1584434.1 polysaccharide deacetylase family protein [Tetragenococcus koreensis]MCF1613983.1 polysaccharide deacetylase family protein [Tetragenococcus koreensis]MCF1619802.1 polysaccharide deacetylase family protein [Tetragenococcus koreensis]